MLGCTFGEGCDSHPTLYVSHKNEVFKINVCKKEMFKNEIIIIMTFLECFLACQRIWIYSIVIIKLSTGIGSCIALNAGIAPAAIKGEVVPGKTRISVMGFLSCEQGIFPDQRAAGCYPMPSKEGESPTLLHYFVKSNYHKIVNPPHLRLQSINILYPTPHHSKYLMMLYMDDP